MQRLNLKAKLTVSCKNIVHNAIQNRARVILFHVIRQTVCHCCDVVCWKEVRWRAELSCLHCAVAEAEMRHVRQLEHKDTEMTALKSRADDAEQQHHVQLTRLQMDVSNNCFVPVSTARRNARRCTSYSISVRLSHAGIVTKRLHVARCSLHCQIAKCV